MDQFILQCQVSREEKSPKRKLKKETSPRKKPPIQPQTTVLPKIQTGGDPPESQKDSESLNNQGGSRLSNRKTPSEVLRTQSTANKTGLFFFKQTSTTFTRNSRFMIKSELPMSPQNMTKVTFKDRSTMDDNMKRNNTAQFEPTQQYSQRTLTNLYNL